MAIISQNIKLALLALCLLGLDTAELFAQRSPFDAEQLDRAALIRDGVSGFADRSLYIAGESIKFSMRVQTSGLPSERDWSRILYVDLISASGVRQAQGKFRIHAHRASGELLIPEGLRTGSYVLRAYTRWMRNRGPSSYVYLPLRIINPFAPELDVALPGEQQEHSLGPLSMHEGGLEISTGSLSHASSDAIEVELLHRAGDDRQRVHGCLSIVPAVARPGPAYQVENPDSQGEAFKLDYLPDLFGVSISGRVSGGEEDPTLEGCRIHFTILGEQPGYAVARADAHGRFTVSLPNREGNLELFVQPEQDGAGAREVRIDQDFDSRVLALDLPAFSLDPKEREGLILMARKHQLSGIFRDTAGGETPGNVVHGVPIYGTPDFRLTLDDYVLLPSLEEVFINLVHDVTPIARRNRIDLSIASVNPAIGMFPPLLMIDQVPIFSMEQFLSIPPREISHIDLINDVFARGDLRFGGIINLWSQEGNMAGIDLPEASFFIDYVALTPQPHRPGEGDHLEDHLEDPLEDPLEDHLADHLPDTRNTLLWMPELQLEASVPRSISFTAPEYPGKYVIIFRGWDEQGRMVSAETPFLVE